ncbi:hypothetical protein SH1V18_16700 [Vallitalea longa]|uniref:Uncharacterized protein n=1 Tax=Vallitalea longa TaxID=2936439 RepID=A0A9W6DE72_9FIRM|nr:hypothetical protein [Vallitalea longa]GKX29190.1 hypothetical protein SH1V18_16700 [Vallitalea longa]
MAGKTTTRKYKKDQILRSNQFTVTDKYLIEAILEDKDYSLEQVKSLLEKEKKRSVK